ncbi:MAG: HTH domain-containing protein [Candidatus Aminicenantes bacterium]|nr:HTH domain-containing protein [Candidatus Aminicenantes bacterium]
MKCVICRSDNIHKKRLREVAVEKFSDTIIINNPGGLVASFPLEDFGTLSWPRNRLLADLLSKTSFMEKVGTGIKRIEQFCKENNNVVEIKPVETHFFVKMWGFVDRLKDGVKDRVKDGVKVGVNDGVKDGVKLSKTQEKLLELVMEDKKITGEEMSEKVGISARSVEKNIAKLKKKGVLIRKGSDKTGYWQVKARPTKDGVNDRVKVGVKVGVKDGVKDGLKDGANGIVKDGVKDRAKSRKS